VGGLTLDSGALIAFERGERRVLVHLKEAERRGYELTVPTAVVAEVWRGGARSARVAALFAACSVEPLNDQVARVAGEAIGAVDGAGVVDAVVMSSAARRGDRVLTSDHRDLARLRARFPDVTLIRL
jgi:predicted nucleic acid-binding protein